MTSQAMNYTLFTCDRCGEQWKDRDHLHGETSEVALRSRGPAVQEIPNADLCWRCTKDFDKFMEAKAHIRVSRGDVEERVKP